MINNEAFIERLGKILEHYELTATALADSLGVQRSGISHILSGRNKPSLEFVMKLVHAYPEVSLYWLLEGQGDFPATAIGREPSQGDVPTKPGGKDIARILVLYSDGSFESFDRPQKN